MHVLSKAVKCWAGPACSERPKLECLGPLWIKVQLSTTPTTTIDQIFTINQHLLILIFILDVYIVLYKMSNLEDIDVWLNLYVLYLERREYILPHLLKNISKYFISLNTVCPHLSILRMLTGMFNQCGMMKYVKIGWECHWWSCPPFSSPSPLFLIVVLIISVTLDLWAA
jgi:hypothetical protein